MDVRNSFHDELKALHCRLLEMGSLVEYIVDESVQSLTRSDLDQAEAVIAADDRLDLMASEIEERCISLMASQPALRRELRLLTAIFKTAKDLERIGDNATNIAKVTLRIADQKLVKDLVDITRMAKVSIYMVHQALDSLVRRDEGLAREVVLSDDVVDKLYADLLTELIELMENGRAEGYVAQCANLMFVARFLERIADHATNIAESVIYLLTGKRKKEANMEDQSLA